MAGFLILAGCLNPQTVKPAVDMFSVYDGRPSTATEREQALNDCYSYNESLRLLELADISNQICMLQLGFRAPDGEIPGLMTTNIQASAEGCVGDAGNPVCWAAKYGWPQDPPPRWAKSGASPYDLVNVWGACFAGNAGVYPYAAFAARMDQCMVQKHGYTVVRPQSPAVPWLPRKYWPDCKKPEAEMNWLEKKWCPPGPWAAPRPAN
ncbi:MAG: hypothetical protein EPN40_05285 [Rhodanobacteraceae bacterium]|nr:MAG: hypothetical protein EPN40_05285 [Rhodanobacteraceae bacterium]